MERLPQAEAVLLSFAWRRLEEDGTFNIRISGRNVDPVAVDPLNRHLMNIFHHLDGHDLLHRKGHLTDEKGWKLRPELIPFREISKLTPERMPSLVTEFEGGVVDWDTWHRWRKLPQGVTC